MKVLTSVYKFVLKNICCLELNEETKENVVVLTNELVISENNIQHNTIVNEINEKPKIVAIDIKEDKSTLSDNELKDKEDKEYKKEKKDKEDKEDIKRDLSKNIIEEYSETSVSDKVIDNDNKDNKVMIVVQEDKQVINSSSISDLKLENKDDKDNTNLDEDDPFYLKEEDTEFEFIE